MQFTGTSYVLLGLGTDHIQAYYVEISDPVSVWYTIYDLIHWGTHEVLMWFCIIFCFVNYHNILIKLSF